MALQHRPECVLVPVPPVDFGRSYESERPPRTASDTWSGINFGIRFSGSSSVSPMAAPSKPPQVAFLPYDIIRDTSNAAKDADSSYNPNDVRTESFDSTLAEANVGPADVVLSTAHDILVSFGGPAAVGAFIKSGIDKLIEWRKASGDRELKVKVGEMEISAKNKRDLMTAVKAALAMQEKTRPTPAESDEPVKSSAKDTSGGAA